MTGQMHSLSTASLLSSPGVPLAYAGPGASRTFLHTSHPAQAFPIPGGKQEIPRTLETWRAGPDRPRNFGDASVSREEAFSSYRSSQET